MTFRIITVNETSEGSGNENLKPYETPKYLHDMGICLCDNCGKVHSIDYAFCNDCFRKIFIVVIPGEKPDEAKIIEEIKKRKIITNKNKNGKN